MKLFNDTVAIKPLPSLEKLARSKESDIQALESDFVALNDTVNAYVSVGTVVESIAEESYSFVDKKNHVLFNEYIKNVTKNLGLETVPVVTLESLDTLPGTVVNSEIALEGFLSNLWEKVKSFFSKIYETIKAFLIKHLTRMGRMKNKLENLKEVLSETDKDLKTINLDKVPGPIAKAFPYEGDISSDNIEEGLSVVKGIINILKVVNKDAIALAGKDVLDKDFVSTVKNLKDQVSINKDKIDENEGDRVKGVKGLYGEGRATNKKINSENETLSDINKANEKEIASKEAKLKGTVNRKENIEAAFNDDSFEAAKREMSGYYSDVSRAFKAIQGKNIPGGKTLKEVKISEDGIELDFDENKDTPDTVSLGGRDKLKKMISEMLSSINELEKTTEGYGKVNDAVMKNLDTVNSLMKDLDKVSDNPDYAAYKSVLEKKVRERLKFMQKFFTDYNKISKNLIEAVSSVGDGIIAYSVSSLKQFG